MSRMRHGSHFGAAVRLFPDFPVVLGIPTLTTEDNTMTKFLTRLAFGLWIVGAPLMLVGCGDEGEAGQHQAGRHQAGRPG